jgi:hypothetical protein
VPSWNPVQKCEDKVFYDSVERTDVLDGRSTSELDRDSFRNIIIIIIKVGKWSKTHIAPFSSFIGLFPVGINGGYVAVN